jgi:hypothetical protein
MRPARSISALAAAALLTAAPAGAAPPSTLFKSGYDKCKLASLAAIDKAAGKTVAKGSFDGKVCTWSSRDGNYVILLDSHPSGYLELMVPSPGKHNGELVKAIKVAGASKALLDTHSFANTHRYQKDLFAVYAQGVVQVSMDYSTALPDAALVAVMRLVTRT